MVVNGMYRFVRYPICFCVIVMSISFALFAQSWLTLFEAVALALFFDFKSRREEGCDVRDQNCIDSPHSRSALNSSGSESFSSLTPASFKAASISATFIFVCPFVKFIQRLIPILTE